MKSEQTREKMALARKKWYLNNPEKALLKAKKCSETKIREGTHKGNKNSNYGSGVFRGIPYRGNIWNKGLTKNNNEILRRLSEINKGDKNPNWKGDNVGITPLHNWIRRHKPKPLFCENCGIAPPYDLANISGLYKRDINDYKWVCRSCHMKEDGRIFNLKNYKEVITA